MQSHEEELDPNWVCCLLEDIPACGESDCFDSTAPWATCIYGSVPCSNSPSLCPQDLNGGSDGPEECCRKRARGASSSKACREKMRRDRVNERFLELSALLDPGTTPKCDKTAILSDAIRVVNMLHEETSRLKDQSTKLKEKINELKSEKNELRAEKNRLKAEKEEIEKRIRGLGPNFGLHLHPTVMPPSYTIPYQVVGNKPVPLANSPGVPFWQFVPQNAVDTSQDHVLRPPVA